MKWNFLKNKKENVEITKPQESEKSLFAENINTCISCGKEIPEGTLVCMECEKGLSRPRCVCCDTPLQNGQSVCAKCSKLFLKRKSK